MMYLKRLAVFVLVLTFLVCNNSIAKSFSVTPKPQAQVRIFIQLQSSVDNPSEVSFTVTAHSAIDLSEARITVDLPEDVSLQSGSLDWSGNLSRGDNRSLEFTLKVDASRFFTLAAQIQGLAFNKQTLIASASFARKAKNVSTAIAQQSRQRTVNRKKGTAIEYALD